MSNTANSATTNPKVSVIIPIYNVESFLAECLDSVLAQTLPDIEIICVNDGSTDNSLEIIEQYAEKDSRIVTVNKENGGYGKAVNKGLEMARGDWISIVEPDDIIGERMYSDLLALSRMSDGSTADIVKGSYWLYFHFEGQNPYVERPNLMDCMPGGSCEINLKEDPEIIRHHPSIWSAIYRRDFIEANGIRMIEPQGAGWADNPWLFDTMFAAKKIMWTPVPYYYYRQTNPEASSNLKDYHLPFDRLRDIRAIYEREGITDTKLLSVLYQRTFSYINTSILETYRFPENDPGLQELIAEALESLDEELLLSDESGVPQRRKNYYKDFMGLFLEELEPKEAPKAPLISFVIAMHDDREGLWDTINSLTNQTYGNFEAICIDCNSSDRSAAIAGDVAKIDKRFKLLTGADSASEGNNMGLRAAKGEYVLFIRPGQTVGSRRSLGELAGKLKQLDSSVEFIVFRTSFPRSRLVPKGADVQAVEVSMEGAECDVLLAATPNLSTRIFNRRFLVDQGLTLDDPRDPEGWTMSVKLADRAKKAAFVAWNTLGGGTRALIDRQAIRTEDELIEFAIGRCDAIFAASEAMGSKVARKMALCSIARCMMSDMSILGRYRSGERYFETLRDAFENKYGIRDTFLADCPNYLDFAKLQESFSLSYDEYAKALLTNQQTKITNLSGSVARARGQVSKLKSSGSYMFGKAASDAVGKIVPDKAIKRAVDLGVSLKRKL